MGPGLAGLDVLLSMPFGDGEESMLKFAGNIYVMLYLTTMNQMSPTIQKKAINYLNIDMF